MTKTTPQRRAATIGYVCNRCTKAGLYQGALTDLGEFHHHPEVPERVFLCNLCHGELLNILGRFFNGGDLCQT